MSEPYRGDNKVDQGGQLLDLLVAAMKDAALELRLSQIFVDFDPFEGKALPVYKRRVRIVVIPEDIEYKFKPATVKP
jgi:hypothetical protein